MESYKLLPYPWFNGSYQFPFLVDHQDRLLVVVRDFQSILDETASNVVSWEEAFWKLDGVEDETEATAFKRERPMLVLRSVEQIALVSRVDGLVSEQG